MQCMVIIAAFGGRTWLQYEAGFAVNVLKSCLSPCTHWSVKRILNLLLVLT